MELNEIKELNLFEIFLNYFGYEYKKKKSSKYGYFFKSPFGNIWVRYDYRTNKWFYTNLDSNSDNGTLIDWIQNHVLNEKNIGKVKKYLKENNIIDK